MQFKIGLADESFKYHYGIDEFNNDGEYFGKYQISLISAKRDWAVFQVLIQAPQEFTISVGDNPTFSTQGPLTNVRLKASIDGLAGAAVNMYPVGLVEDDDRLLKSDILLNQEVIHVEGWKTQPVWVEIAVPENTRAGIYNGQVELFAHSMFEDEVKLQSLTFTLDVKDVTLPMPKDYSFHLDLWQHLSNIARKHEVRLWSDEHFNIIEEYIKTLGDLGQKSITILASEIPWSGQRGIRVKNYLSDLFEYSMIKVEKDEEGKFLYDFSIMDRYIKLCGKYGIDKEIEVFGLVNIWLAEEGGYGAVAEDYPDAIRIRYYDRRDCCYKFMKSGQEVKDYIKALEKFFIESNYIDSVRIIADEPSDLELYKVRLGILREVAPSFQYKTAINHVEFIDECKELITDFVPILPCACEKWELLEKMRSNIKGRLSWYVCWKPDYPNTLIKSPLVESRLVGLLTAYMNFDGFLRWNYTVWPENPRERISYRYPVWKAGDTHFVYPAWNGKPLLTLRYKNLKRGIEDFELIQMIKKNHPDSDKILQKVWEKVIKFKDISNLYAQQGNDVSKLYSLNYSDYQDVKELLLTELESLYNSDI